MLKVANHVTVLICLLVTDFGVKQTLYPSLTEAQKCGLISTSFL